MYSYCRFILAFIVVLNIAPTTGFMRVCYFPGWSSERQPFAKFGVADVDPQICTHLLYAFAKMDINNYKLINENDSGYKDFVALKSKNQQLKTLLSIGGQNEDINNFVSVTRTDEVTNAFVKNIVEFLKIHDFDGLDIDWEYPNNTTSSNYINLLKGLRNAFNQYTTSKLILMVAAPAGRDTIDKGYNVTEINKLVDYVTLMTYDFVDPRYSEVTNFNSPLFSSGNLKFNQEFSTNWTVEYYKNRGLALEKMLIGVTGAGKWLVLNDTKTDLGAVIVRGALRISPYYNISGGIAYPEICKDMLSNANITFDQTQKAVYLVKDDNWITFENTETITYKAKWAKQTGLAGLMFWSLDQDDFGGKACNQGKYPLMSAVKLVTEPTPTGIETTRPPGKAAYTKQCITYLMTLLLLVHSCLH